MLSGQPGGSGPRGGAALRRTPEAGAVEPVALVLLVLAMLVAHGELAQSRVAVLGLGAVAVLLVLHRPSLFGPLRGLSWVKLFAAYLVGTLAWSQARTHTLSTLWLLGIEVVLGLALAHIHGRHSSARTAETALRFLVVACFAAAILSDSARGVGAGGYWQGVFTSKNELGLFAGFAAVHFASYGSRRSRVLWVAAAVALILLARSQASLVAVTAGLAVQILAARFLLPRAAGRSPRRLRFAVAVAAVAVAAYLTGNRLLELLGKDRTFNRRTDIWQEVIDYAAPHRWFGTGLGAQVYSGSALETRIQAVGGPTVHSTHNGYLTTYLGGGLVGCALLALAVVSIVRLLLKVTDTGAAHPDVLFLAGVLAVYLVDCFAEDVSLKRGAVLMLMLALGRVRVVRADSDAPDGMRSLQPAGVR